MRGIAREHALDTLAFAVMAVIRPAYVIAVPLRRRAHQAEARRARIKRRMQL